MQTSEGWARLLRGQRHIGDFTGWKEHDSYQKSFDRLMRDLRVETQYSRFTDHAAEGGVAACGGRAAGGEAAEHWFPESERAFGRKRMGPLWRSDCATSRPSP
jgi:hypothetical protein